MGNSSSSVSFADRELAHAAEKGNLPRVKFLIERDGASVNFQDNFGWSPLLHAVSEGHLDIIKFLLTKGATTTHVTADRANAIHHAITSQNDSVLLFLLQYGTCDVNAKNEDGWTPLHLACLSNQYQAVKLLLQFKADPTLVNNEGKTPADVTTSVAIRNLLERGPTSPRGKLDEISPEEEQEITEEQEMYQNKGTQKSLQQLQHMQNQPKSPVEMKGYVYLSDEQESNDELHTITVSNNSNNNNNNNSQTNGLSRTNSKTISGEKLVEREYKRIFEAINVLRGIEPDNLTMAQVQELIGFHQSELQKYLEAKRIMEEIRAKELELMLAE